MIVRKSVIPFRRMTCLGLAAFALAAGCAFVTPAWSQEGEQQQESSENQGNQQQQQQSNEQQSSQQQQQADQREAEQRRRAQQERQARRRAEPEKTPSGPSLGEFKARLDTESMMLRIHPEGRSDRQDFQVTVGEEFTTEISFDNQNLLPFQEIRVLLSYDTDYLQPMSINDSMLAPHLKVEPTAEVDPSFGVIMYEAQLEEPVVLNDVPVLKVRWKAEQVTRTTLIEFSSREDIHTAIVGRGQDLLGNPGQPGDGTLNTSVTILPEDPREAEAMLNSPKVYEGTDAKVGGVKLFIRPPEETPVVGEVFSLDLALDNTAFSNIDNLQVLLTFDPQIFRVLDKDRDNYITIQKNIHDGPFHDKWPWNYHIDNVVYQHRGIISYRVGTDNPDVARGKSGTFARIYMVPKRPTSGSPIVFRFSRKPRTPGTEITFNGRDALGDPQVFADGARGIVVSALPAVNKEVAQEAERLRKEQNASAE